MYTQVFGIRGDFSFSSLPSKLGPSQIGLVIRRHTKAFLMVRQH